MFKEGCEAAPELSCEMSWHKQAGLLVFKSLNPPQHSVGGLASGPVTYEEHGINALAAESQLGGLGAEAAPATSIANITMATATLDDLAMATNFLLSLQKPTATAKRESASF